MNLSTLTVYFLLLRIYPVLAVKDTDDLVIRESSYQNVIQDAIATGEHDGSKLLSGKNRLNGDFERKDFLHAKKDQANNNRIGAKRVKKGPSFVKEMRNVSIAVGRDATIDCHVSNAEDYKVAWFNVETTTVLSFNDVLITRNPRYSVKKEEGEENILNWKLVIHDVKKKDEGFYQCQLNTDPTKARNAYLEVTTPPEIDDDHSSDDIIVTEGYPITLTCRARGHPTPIIEWKREDGRPVRAQGNGDGSSISIPAVARTDAGAFLCIASNGISPAVSRRITVTVMYEPSVHMNGEVVRVRTGDRVHLNCTVKGIPTPDISWFRNQNNIRRRIETGDSKHFSRNKLSSEAMVVSSLEIVFIEISDDSVTYECAGNNSQGHEQDRIEIKVIETVPTYEVPRNTKTETRLRLRNDYGPIDENVSHTNDQFKIESKRKAKYKNNDQKTRNQERNQRKKYRKNVSDDTGRTTIWRMNHSSLNRPDVIFILFASLVSYKLIFQFIYNNFGLSNNH